ncbi:copper transport protein [Actinoplanes derwentensis]|uniref:Copper transport protein n=2 Tax=Actinoplanes derwentensis TaxID=113562 RepID=A0A1H1R199_9ACTN|nr:hypothetical protein Ade03nite_60530 [Actinoplanes derwentensis]SDS29571.1 copper transport protein [Actinoplanes derwentensis]
MLFLFVLLASLTLPASPASAHAAPVGATPAPGSVIGASPAEVTVTFSEPVTPVEGRVQVIAPNGDRISGKAVVEGTTMRIPVRQADKPLGTYLISFRVISADSHPVGGAISFSVGAPSERPEAPSETIGTHPSVEVAVPVFKTIGYAGITLIAGPAMFLAFLWPRRRSRSGALKTVRVGLALTAFATLGAIASYPQQGSGAPLWQVSAQELTETVTSEFGLLLVGRLAILGVLAGLLLPMLSRAPRTARARVLVGAGAPVEVVPADQKTKTTFSRTRPYAVLALSAAGLATWPLTGHAVAAPMSGITVTAGVVHMAAMAVWIGGLVTLAVFLLRGTHPRVLGVVLPVWSRWAAIAVLWLVFAGAIQAVVQMGKVSALWETGYGQLLIAKLGVTAAVLGAAAFARRMVVAGAAGAGVRRAVGIEVAASVVILALSSVLVQVDPGRIAATKEKPITGQGFSETLTSDLYAVQFNIYPVELGEYNTIHAFLYTPDGGPLRAEEWQVTARLTDPALEAVAQPIAGLPTGNQALGSMSFPLPGTYEITFTIRTTEIDRASVKTSVTVGG